MASELNLVPDVRLVFQGVIYLAAVASANHYLIKPALRLHQERRKRTTGAIDSARTAEQRAEQLEAVYNQELRARTDEVRNLRLSEVLAGQAEAEAILGTAQDRAREHVQSIQSELEANLGRERARLPTLVDDIVATIVSRLVTSGGARLLVLGFGMLALGSSAEAAPTGAGSHGSVWDSIIWPYFQFACFFGALVYFGRKVIHSILESRRDALKTRLSEAKQAVVLAQRKTQEFEQKTASLQREIQELREQYVTDGVKERAKIVSDAQKLAAQIIADAERSARELVARGKEDLRKELMELAVKSVEERLSASQLEDIDKRLKAEVMQSLRQAPVH